MPRWVQTGFALLAAGIACAAPPRRIAPNEVPPAEPPPPPVARKPIRPPAAPLLEDEHGVLGAPRDDTGFDFEPEVADSSDTLVLDGVPPSSPSVLRSIGGYLDVRRARLASVSPDGKSMLVLTRLGETTQAHLVRGPLMAREQVTFGPDPVQQVSFVPKDPNRITYRVDRAGDEQFQVVVLDLTSRRARLVSDGTNRHGPFRWSPKGSRLAVTKTIPGTAAQELLLGNGRSPGDPLLSLEGEWVTLGWSRNEKRILLQQFWSAADSRLHVADVETGVLAPVDQGATTAAYPLAFFTGEPDSLLATSNREGDFVQLYRHDLEKNEWKSLSADIPWDVEEVAPAPDGKVVVFSVNEDGTSALWMAIAGVAKPSRLDLGVRGVVSDLRFFGSPRRLAFTFTPPNEPSDVFTFDIGTRRLTRWTRSETGGINPARFVSPELVRYESFDGRRIPAYVFRPPSAERPVPVLVWVHGGPEEQFRPVFDPMVQYLAARGIAVVAPNVRGSTGYGKTYLGLDDGLRREDAIADIGALLDWIAAQEDLDETRVGIHGASYGGYVVLATLARYGRRLVAGCDVVGISNFVTFLENTQGYRRDLRRAEYGDERDPAVRSHLLAISPVHHADRIQSALFVAHGMRDPRVPIAEAEKMVEAARGAGNDVWYMVAPNEGHSFRQRRNRDTLYRSVATFFETYLLARRESDALEEKTNAAPMNPTDDQAAVEPR